MPAPALFKTLNDGSSVEVLLMHRKSGAAKFSEGQECASYHEPHFQLMCVKGFCYVSALLQTGNHIFLPFTVRMITY